MKIQSINRKFNDIKLFLNYIYDSSIFGISSITKKDIIDCVDVLVQIKPHTTIKNVQTYIKQFLYFYSQSFKTDLDAGIVDFLNTNYLKAYVEDNKYSNIPTEYFNKLMSLCLSLMNNIDTPQSDREFGAIIILLSQTGIRQSNLFDLKANSLNKKSILNGEKTAYYLNYEDFKKEKGNNSYCIENIFTRFSLKYRDKLDNINNDNLKDLSQFELQALLKRQMYSREYYDDLNLTDIISVPRAHQFRVHLCTKLYRQGVH